MERKTYTIKREIPDRRDVVYGIEQYYQLLKGVAYRLESSTFLPHLPDPERTALYDDMKALGRIITDFGHFLEDVLAFEEEEDRRDMETANESNTESERETE